MRKDHLGNIWTFPKGTLTRIAPIASKPDSLMLVPYPMPELNPERAIWDFIFDETGWLWLSLNGREVWRMPVVIENKAPKLLFDKAEKIKTAGENASLFYRFVHDPFKKELCVVGFEGTLNRSIIREVGRFDKEKNVFSTIKTSEGFGQVFNFRAIEFDGRGNLWIADWGGGVFRITDFDSQPKLASMLENSPFMWKTNHALAVDNNGHVWVGGQGGLYKIHYTWDHFAILKGFSGKDDYRLSHCVEDDQGKIWCRANDEGLVRFDPPTTPFALTCRRTAIWVFRRKEI
ncbi:MAG: hypothetical protein IPM82_16115 [Saprospiraceae bacterium]|nr:hypothetical protein [Saprospiraceae bacterium]